MVTDDATPQLARTLLAKRRRAKALAAADAAVTKGPASPSLRRRFWTFLKSRTN